jgi:hypothetical protein
LWEILFLLPNAWKFRGLQRKVATNQNRLRRFCERGGEGIDDFGGGRAFKKEGFILSIYFQYPFFHAKFLLLQ